MQIEITARTTNLVTGLLGVTLGGATLITLPWQAGIASLADAVDPGGPGFFPMIAAGVALLAGLAMLAQWALARGLGQAHIVRAAQVGPMIAGLAGFCVAMYAVGMLPAMGVLVAYTAWRFDERRLSRMALLGGATPVAVYLLFEMALKILFPTGWLV